MLKYVKYIENSGEKEAQMLLFGTIGGDINGNLFAQELEQQSNIPGLTACRIKINSVGGSVFQGMSVLAAIDIVRSKGIPVYTENVGVAYSMAGIILVAGDQDKRSSVDYGTVMIHDPKFSFGEPEKDSEKNMLQKMTDSLTSIIEKNSTLDNAKTRDFMSKETTFSSKESKKHGFIDSIRNTGKKLKPISNHVELMVACSDIYNQKPKSKKMKLITDFLQLTEDASENSILNAVKALDQSSEIQLLTDEKTTLKNSLELLKTENATLKETAVTAQAETLVNKAVDEGRITDDGKGLWVESAKKDFDGTKKLIEGLNVVPGSINDQLTDDSKGESDLVTKYEKLLETPELLDELPQKEVEAMEAAYEKSIEVNTQLI